MLVVVAKKTSPPTWKFAFSPEIAVKVGSASVRMTLACSMAWMVAPMPKLPMVADTPAEVPLPVVVPAMRLSTGVLLLTRPAVTPPPVPEMLLLMPSCLRIERFTSATVILRVTWSCPSIWSRLTICDFWRCSAKIAAPPAELPPVAVMLRVVASPPVTKMLASCAARAESCGVRTVPVRTMLSLMISTLMLESGMKRASCFCRPATSRSIDRSIETICRPSAPKTKMFVCPTALPKR